MTSFRPPCSAPALALELWTDWGVRGKWGKKLPMLGKGQFQFWKPPDRFPQQNCYIFLRRKKIVKSTCDIKKVLPDINVIYPRSWIIQTRWNMSLGVNKKPPGYYPETDRVLCRPQGQRASRLTMQHPPSFSSSAECSLGKSTFSSHDLIFFKAFKAWMYVGLFVNFK